MSRKQNGRGVASRPVATAAVLALVALLAGCAPRASEGELLQSGQDALQAGKPREAMIHLKNLLTSHPGNADARLLLGQALLDLGDHAGARTEFQKALEAGVTRERLGENLAVALIGAGDYEAALVEIDRLAAAAGAPLPRHLELRADVLVRHGRIEEGIDSYRKAIELEPGRVSAVLGLAGALASTGDFDDALAHAEQAREIAPKSFEALLLHAQILLRTNRVSVAQEAFSQLVAKLPAEPVTADEKNRMYQALSGLAEAQLASSDIEAATSTVQRLVRLFPETVHTKLLQARISLARGRLDEARIALETLISARPDDARARLLMGAVTLAQGNLEQAEMYLASTVAAEPANRTARRLLAETRLRQRKPGEALQILEGSIEESGSDSALLNLAGRSAFAAGQTQEAIGYLERSAQADPDSMDAKLALVGGYITAGQVPRALELLAQVRPADPPSIDRRDALLILAHARGNDEAAARSAIQSILSRKGAGLRQTLIAAQGYLLLGRSADAKKLIETALQDSPQNPELALAAARLESAEGRLDEAYGRLLRLREAVPGTFAATLALAQNAASRGDLSQTRRWLAAAVEEDPSFAPARVRLARLHLSQKEFAAAHAVAVAGLRLAPKHAELLTIAGAALASQGKTREADELFAEISAPQSGAWRVPLSIAQHLAASGQSELAVAHAQRAVRLAATDAAGLAPACAVLAHAGGDVSACVANLKKIAPESIAAWLIEGDAAMSRSAFAEAVRAYERAFQQETSAVVAARLAAARQRSGESMGTALQRIESLLGKAPQDRGAHAWVAHAQLAAGNQAAAARHFEAALAAAPNDPVFLNNLAWLYFEAGDKRALPLAERAYASAPGVPEVADTYGWLLVNAGDLARGVQLLREAARARPASDEIQYHLADALVRHGDRGGAIKVLERMLQSGGDSPALEQARALAQSLSEGR